METGVYVWLILLDFAVILEQWTCFSLFYILPLPSLLFL